MKDQPRSQEEIFPRKYPYPYRAALTICSDIDATDYQSFILVQKFLNTVKETPLGKGLGLEIGNSFWFYSDPANPDHALSYFEPDKRTLSPYAENLRELIRAGYLDVLHSYGNFSRDYPFKRELAERAIQELIRYNLQIKVWTNHGDRFNCQSIGAGSAGAGDIPPSPDCPNPCYHCDLLKTLGIRYFWESERGLTELAGQERRLNSSDSALLNPATDLPVKLRKLFHSILVFFPKSRDALSGYTHLSRKNDLIEPIILRDGTPMIRFCRFGHARFDWGDDLPRIMNQRFLECLLKNQGISIIYIHLGDRRRKGNSALTPKTIHSLRILTSYYDQGRMLVSTTCRLLGYITMFKLLNYAIQRGNTTDILVDFPDAFSSFGLKIGVEDLQGLTFYTKEPIKTRIIFEGKTLPTVINPPDGSGMSSIMVPWEKLTFPL